MRLGFRNLKVILIRSVKCGGDKSELSESNIFYFFIYTKILWVCVYHMWEGLFIPGVALLQIFKPLPDFSKPRFKTHYA